jgi:hypothetical protein
MIIGYYPGAGGNRYLNYTLGKDFAGEGAYDNKTTKVQYRGEYLLDNTILATQSVVALLHCVNYTRIQECFPNETNVVIIKTDLKTSLCREWSIKGKNKPMFYPTEDQTQTEFLLELYKNIKDPTWPVVTSLLDIVNLPLYIQTELQIQSNNNQKYIDNQGIFNYLSSAYSAIAWHNHVYTEFPMEYGSAQVIDINHDQSEFSQVIQKELDLYKNNTLFNFAWSVFETHGADAPIIDLYNQYVQ